MGLSKKDDMRVMKTYTSLMDSLFSLLQKFTFNRITVNNLCASARISRTTFYTHFFDKYDLLKYWLYNSGPVKEPEEDTHTYISKVFDNMINHKTRAIKNLLEETNNETMNILNDYMISLLNINLDDDYGMVNISNCEISNKAEYSTDEFLQKSVLSTFCAGGMINYLSRLLKYKHDNLAVSDKCFFEMIDTLLELFNP